MGKFFKREFVDTWKGFSKEKIKPSTLLLVVANVVCLLVSNIIAVKTLFIDNGSGGSVLSFGSGSSYVEFKLPLAVLLYGAAVIISDVLAEKDWIWTRRSCHIGFLLNLIMVGVFAITIAIPGQISGFTDVGNTGINIVQPWGEIVNTGMMNTVLGSSWYMLIASMISFFVGDLINDTVFKKLKEKDGVGKGKLVKRCVVSTMCGQLLDSFIFITFGLYLFPMLVTGTPFIGFDYSAGCLGAWGGFASVLCSVLFQFVVKVIWELLLSPVIIKICNQSTQEVVDNSL